MTIVCIGVILLELILFATTYNYTLPKKQVIFLLSLMVLALAFLGAFIEPKEAYDLSRHYDLLSSIKNSSFTLTSYLKEGPEFLNWNYRYTYIFNVLCYLIARYLPFQALPFITILICYSLLMYIVISYFGEGNLINKNIFFSICLCQATMPYLFIYSGIRNGLASSIIAFAIYRFVYCNHNYFELGLLAIVSILVHPIGFVILPFFAFSKIKPGIKSMVVPFVLPTAVFAVTEYLRANSSSNFLFSISAKYYNYTQVRTDNQGIAFLLCSISVLLLISAHFIYYTVRKKPFSDDPKSVALLNVLTWYSLFSLGYFTSYEMILRLPYNFALLSPIIVDSILKNKKKLELVSTLEQIAMFGLFIISVYETVVWLI